MILLVLVYLIKTELIICNFIISKSSPVLPHGLPVNIVNKIQQLEEVRDCISFYSLYNPLSPPPSPPPPPPTTSQYQRIQLLLMVD